MAKVSQSSGSRWLPVAATVLFGGAVAAATFAATRYAYQQELERRYGAADGSRHRCGLLSMHVRGRLPNTLQRMPYVVEGQHMYVAKHIVRVLKCCLLLGHFEHLSVGLWPSAHLNAGPSAHHGVAASPALCATAALPCRYVLCQSPLHSSYPGAQAASHFVYGNALLQRYRRS